MKNVLFILIMLGVFTFSNYANAQAIASSQPLLQSEVSTFYAQVFHLEVGKPAKLSYEMQTSATALDVTTSTVPEVDCKDEITTEEEGLFCRVYKPGTREVIASCVICNCTLLASEALKQVKPSTP